MSTDTAMVERKPDKLVVHDSGPTAYLFDTARFEHMQRIASAMAGASLIPEHLVGKVPQHDRDDAAAVDWAYKTSFRQTVGNCLLIVNQAVRWGLDPFAVAPETYVVRGKLGFQGKLVAAVVNARAGLKGRLSYSYTGSGDDRTITVSGQFKDEAEPRTITLSVKQAKTDNDMWKKDPDQKLVYTGATKWARRHCPEIMLGVLTDDDMEQVTVNGSARAYPQSLDDLADRLGAPSLPQSSNGNGHHAEPESHNPPEDTTRPQTTDDIDQEAVDKATLTFLNCTTEKGLQYELDNLPTDLNDKTMQAIAGAAHQRREAMREAEPKSGKKTQGELVK